MTRQINRNNYDIKSINTVYSISHVVQTVQKGSTDFDALSTCALKKSVRIVSTFIFKICRDIFTKHVGTNSKHIGGTFSLVWTKLNIYILEQ